MGQPKFSIIISTYNYGDYLGATLESILVQTFTDFEVVLVDDGSMDNTQAVIRLYEEKFQGRLRSVYQNNRGLSAGRNHALRLAKGEYMAYVDSDDLLDKNALERAAKELEAHSDYGMVFGNAQVFESKTGKYLLPFFGKIARCQHYQGWCLEKLFLKKNYIPLSSVVVRKIVMDEVGPFDEGLKVGEDYDMWLRISSLYPIGYIPHVQAFMRRHGKNLSFKSQLHAWAQIKIMKKLLQLVPNLQERVGKEAYDKRWFVIYSNMGKNLVLINQKRRARKFLLRAFHLNRKSCLSKTGVYFLLSYLPGEKFLAGARVKWRDLRRRLFRKYQN